MWYQGDEDDEELSSIIEDIEKKETQKIKEKHKQQQSQQINYNIPDNNKNNSNISINKMSSTDNNSNMTTSNNNKSNRMDAPSPSPSFISMSNSDVVFNIEQLPSPPESTSTLDSSGSNISILGTTPLSSSNINTSASTTVSTTMANSDNDTNSNNNNNNNIDNLQNNLNNLTFGDIVSDNSTTINLNENPLKQSSLSVETTSTPSTPNLNTSNNNNTNNIQTIQIEIPTEIPNKTRSLSNSNNVLKKIDLETQKAIEEGKQVFVNFLKAHTCYDVIPISGKVVVLDTKLAVKSAFYALEENGIKSAPLWNSEQHDFTGMITVSDFIDILLYYYRKPRSNNIFQDMGMHRIETFWREINSVERPSSLISTEPETNLYDAASLLLCYKIHRLPVVDRKDTNSILHILTHSRILAFMMKSLPQLPEKLLSVPIGSLGIGTFATVVTVMTHTPLVEVLELLSAKKISAVPIIDSETSKIVDVYSKSDVTLMSKQGVLSPSDLNLPVHQVLSTFTKLWQRPEQIYTCTRFDKLGDVIEKCIKKRVHRLVCIDSSKKVEGIISLSDILNYLLNDVKHIC